MLHIGLNRLTSPWALTAAFPNKISVCHLVDIPPVLMCGRGRRRVLNRIVGLLAGASGKRADRQAGIPHSFLCSHDALVSILVEIHHAYHPLRSVQRGAVRPSGERPLGLGPLRASPSCISIFQISGIEGRIWRAEPDQD